MATHSSLPAGAGLAPLSDLAYRWATLRDHASGRRTHNRLLWAMTAITLGLGLWQIGHADGVINSADLLMIALFLAAGMFAINAVRATLLGDDWPYDQPEQLEGE